uniref:Uncharacterized protein LOC100181472 n=1 Tax=Phallusia mammillata TaxID=59560 RepID=A0A6F9DGR1_9ASCI|nr:uncharacterized protein LOC100181472 [Phallusia mammillata]
MASAYRDGAFASEEGFQRFLDSIQARGVMYGSNEHSRDRLHDQVISSALNEFDRYWKYIPGGFERLDWTMKIQINPFWNSDYQERMDYMLLNAPKFYQPY